MVTDRKICCTGWIEISLIISFSFVITFTFSSARLDAFHLRCRRTSYMNQMISFDRCSKQGFTISA